MMPGYVASAYPSRPASLHRAFAPKLTRCPPAPCGFTKSSTTDSALLCGEAVQRGQERSRRDRSETVERSRCQMGCERRRRGRLHQGGLQLVQALVTVEPQPSGCPRWREGKTAL